jgi:membrane-associated phospholipid phosphatase
MSMARRPTRPRPVAGALALLSALAALATGLVFALAVHTSAGQRLDEAARGGVSLADSSRAYAATQRLLDTISVSSLALFGLGIMGVAVLRRRPWLAVGAGLVVLGSNVTTQVVKAHFERPDLAGGTGAGEGAFPSGHATVAMSLAMALVLAAPPALRWTAALAGCAYATGVGVAVVALDWHRPSEVVGAYLVAVAWTAAIAAILIASGEGRGGDRRVGSRFGALTAVVLGLAFIAVVGATAGRRLDVVQLVDDRTALALAALAAGAACAGLGAVVTALLQRAEIPSPRRADR